VLLLALITRGRVSEPVGPPYAELLADGSPRLRNRERRCGGASSLDWTLSRAARCAAHLLAAELYELRAPDAGSTILLGANDAIGYLRPARAALDSSAIAEIAANLLRDGASQVMLLTRRRSSWTLKYSSSPYRAEILRLWARRHPVRAGSLQPARTGLREGLRERIRQHRRERAARFDPGDGAGRAVRRRPVRSRGARGRPAPRRAGDVGWLTLPGSAYRRAFGFEKPGDFRCLQAREPLDLRLDRRRPGDSAPALLSANATRRT
jgi:hypothetical protein